MAYWDGSQWIDQGSQGSPSAVSALLASLTQQKPSVIPNAPPGMMPPNGGPVPQGPGMPPSAGQGPGQIQVGNMTAPAVPNAPALNIPQPSTVTGQQGSTWQDKIRNFLTGQAPAAYGNLLSPDEIQQAKPGIIESLLGGGIFAPLLGHAMYQRNLGQEVNMNQLTSQIQANRAQMAENARILASRQKMGQLFPQTPGMPASQQKAQLIGMYNYAVSNGDTEMAKDIGARMNDMFKETTAATTPHVIGRGASLVGPDGKLLYNNPAEMKHQGAAVTYVSPDGKQYRAFFADQQAPPGWKPSVRASGAGAFGGTGFGSGGIGMVARQYAAIAGMDNADAAMKPFEDAVQSGTANYTGLDYYKGMWSKMYDASGHIDPAVHASVYARLNQENPVLANYLASAEQWALEDSQLSGRPSDFRTKLDAYISAIGPNAQKSTIAQRQDFRRTRLKALADVSPAMKAMLDRAAGSDPNAGGGIPMPTEQTGAGVAPASSGPSKAQQLYDAAANFLRKQRKPASEILKQLGQRPTQ